MQTLSFFSTLGLASSLFGAQALSAQLDSQWADTFGGAGADAVLDAAPAPLGATFAVGSTRSFGQGDADGWVARVAQNGAPLWELALGGAGGDVLRTVVNTADGGCIAAGSTTSFGAGGSDGWVVKFDAGGNVQWQRSYGTSGEESFASIAVSRPASFAANYYVGGSSQFGASERDVWVLRLDANGGVLWQRNYAGEKDDELTAIAATDSGLVFVANSNSTFASSSPVPVPSIPFFRPWVVTLHPDGKPDRQRTFDLSGGDALSDVQVLPDGFVLTGEILAMAFFRGDVWVLRLDSQLNIVWDKRYGDHFGVTFVDSGRRVRALRDDGFLVLGSTGTAGAGSSDLYLLRLDTAGNRIADRTLGGTGYDTGSALVISNRTAVVGGAYQQVVPQPGDALLARLTLPGLPSADQLCLGPEPTDPNQWTTPLTLTTPTVEAVSTTAVSAPSAGIATYLTSGTDPCR